MGSPNAMQGHKPVKCGEHGHTTNSGKPCAAWCIPGTTGCKRHVGKKLMKAKAEGRLKLAAAAWSFEDTPTAIDATGEAIRLILVTKQIHADYLAALQAEVMDKDLAALVGVAYSEAGKTGEYITGLAQLEAQERDRLWRFVKDYRQAGFEEKRLEMTQQTVDLLDAALRVTLLKLGLDLKSPDVVAAVLAGLDTLRPALAIG